jgi:phosphoribosylformylglycinamidine cyclo-ligase
MRIGEHCLIDVLLEPTRIYVKPLLALMRQFDIRGLAHITGGGITENLPRILPSGLSATIDLQSWTPPPVFAWLAATGPITETELLRTFNCGIGMIVVVAEGDAAAISAALSELGESVYHIGGITAGTGARVNYINRF